MEFNANAGVQTEIKRSLKAIAVEPTPAPSPVKGELFEDPKQWSHDGNWRIWKNSSFGWLVPKHGVFTVTIQRPKKSIFKGAKKVEWTIDNHENGDGIDYFIEDKTFHRVAYKSGKAISEYKAELAQHPKDYNLTFDVSAQRIVISEAGNGKLDDYERPSASASVGKIGFKGEISVTVQQK
jgi:hypothetical protein